MNDYKGKKYNNPLLQYFIQQENKLYNKKLFELAMPKLDIKINYSKIIIVGTSGKINNINNFKNLFYNE